MFRTVPLSIIRNLFTAHSAMVYVIQVCRQPLENDQDGCLKAVYKPVWHIQLLSVQWINSWWWTDELSETCRVSCQNKFVKLVHLVGFIIKKIVTMHSHMNVKFVSLMNAAWVKYYGCDTVCMLIRHVRNMFLFCTSFVSVVPFPHTNDFTGTLRYVVKEQKLLTFINWLNLKHPLKQFQ
jgi:hypothetical protein